MSPVKAVHVTHDSIYMFRTIYARAGKGKGCAHWPHRQDMGRRNRKHQHWSAIHRHNHLNCHIYFVEKSDDTVMDFFSTMHTMGRWSTKLLFHSCDHGLNQYKYSKYSKYPTLLKLFNTCCHALGMAWITLLWTGMSPVLPVESCDSVLIPAQSYSNTSRQ